MDIDMTAVTFIDSSGFGALVSIRKAADAAGHDVALRISTPSIVRLFELMGLHDSFVIVDEAQSLERNVLLTVLSRLGTGSRVVMTHDIAQRDNLRVGRHDGVAAVIEKLKGHPLFAHITLLRSERSPIAALVTEMLEEIAGPQ